MGEMPGWDPEEWEVDSSNQENVYPDCREQVLLNCYGL